jgi:hypothetical protein
MDNNTMVVILEICYSWLQNYVSQYQIFLAVCRRKRVSAFVIDEIMVQVGIYDIDTIRNKNIIYQ